MNYKLPSGKRVRAGDTLLYRNSRGEVVSGVVQTIDACGEEVISLWMMGRERVERIPVFDIAGQGKSRPFAPLSLLCDTEEEQP